MFEHRTTLASLGIAFEPKSGPSGSVIDFTSTKGVTVEIGADAAGSAGGASGKAHAKVGFTKTGGAVLQASDVSIVVMSDPASVARAVLAKFAKGGWEREWVLVTEVQAAGASTILVSEESEATVELTAEGTVGARVPLAAGFVVSKKSGAVLNWVGQAGLRPLFGLSRVKQSIWDRLFGKKKGTVAVAKHAAVAHLEMLELPEEGLVEEVRPDGSGSVARPAKQSTGKRSTGKRK